LVLCLCGGMQIFVKTLTEDNHPGGWVVWHDRQCEGKDPG
jgi:hypothetical protein